jgi:hypothetical protein
LLAAKNEVINAKVEISRLKAAYADKISKAQSDRFTAESSGFDAAAQVSKIRKQ